MYRYLPYGKFTQLKNVDNFDVNSISKNSSIQHIPEADFEYFDDLPDKNKYQIKNNIRKKISTHK